MVGIFPNEAYITRLIGAVLLEQNDVTAPVPIHPDRGNDRTYTAPDRCPAGQTSIPGRLTNGHLKLHPNCHLLDGRDPNDPGARAVFAGPTKGRSAAFRLFKFSARARPARWRVAASACKARSRGRDCADQDRSPGCRRAAQSAPWCTTLPTIQKERHLRIGGWNRRGLRPQIGIGRHQDRGILVGAATRLAAARRFRAARWRRNPGTRSNRQSDGILRLLDMVNTVTRQICRLRRSWRAPARKPEEVDLDIQKASRVGASGAHAPGLFEAPRREQRVWRMGWDFEPTVSFHPRRFSRPVP